MNDKVLSTLGLAKKAGKIMSGTNLVSTFIRSDNKPYLVLVADDASRNTKKMILAASKHHRVDCLEVQYNMDQFSHAIGASYYISCIAVFDQGFADLIVSRLKATESIEIPKEV